MPIVRPFGFRFRPIPFLAALIAVVIGISLGNWQTRRAAEKIGIEQRLSAREQLTPIVLGAANQDIEQLEFRRAIAVGEFKPGWTVYLDNRPYKGQAGFYVLTPFKLEGSSQHVMVARGWIPRNIADRTRMPDLATPSESIRIEGVVRRNPGLVMQLGSAPPVQPAAILQNLDLAQLGQASGLSLLPFIIEQTDSPASPDAKLLVRDWPRPSTGADKHRGYAFQWYALAATAFIFFVVTGFRRGTH